MRHLVPLLSALALTFTLGAAPVFAQANTENAAVKPAGEPRPDGDASQLYDQINNEIFSPFCPGKTLDMCPSPNAATVRRDILKMSREGYSRDQIKDKVLDTYGEEFRIVEPTDSDNTGLLVALGVGLLLAITAVVVLSRQRRPEDRSPEDDDAIEPITEEDEGYLEELREDLEA